MKCINPDCGKRATPVVKFGKVTGYICEYCGKSFSIRDNGQANQNEIKRLKGDQFQQIMRTGSYRPFKLKLAQVDNGNCLKSKIKMYDPMTR